MDDSELFVHAAAPQYSNLQEMAMKVQTSSEKKAGKTTKKGGKKAAEESDKVSKCRDLYQSTYISSLLKDEKQNPSINHQF